MPFSPGANVKSSQVKYQEAIERNFRSFMDRKASATGEQATELALQTSKETLETLKTKIGIRKADTVFDKELQIVLEEASGSVAKGKKKEKKEAEVKASKKDSEHKATANEEPTKGKKPRASETSNKTGKNR